ncbi:MAG: TolC family protein [Bacteroidetes bacterium]|nr:TolC family protein [Bacteroidota bacterium]
MKLEYSQTLCCSIIDNRRLSICWHKTWTLQQCIDTAQVHNKNLQISRNNMASNEHREKEAKANLIPKVTANADYK